MPWPQTGATHCHTQLGPTDNCDFRQARGEWSGPYLWSGWLPSSSTATPHRYILYITFNLILLGINIVKGKLCHLRNRF